MNKYEKLGRKVKGDGQKVFKCELCGSMESTLWRIKDTETNKETKLCWDCYEKEVEENENR